MATRRIVSLRSSFGKPTMQAILSRPYSSTTTENSPLKLAYDLHPPPKGDHDHRDSPIIFMHGLFGSKKNNRSVSKALARDLKRHVYTIDLRNHGDSPHAPRHDYTAMADDVAGFIHEHGLTDPTLIGHSMGAKTAMTLSLSQPALIRDIVAVDNAPVDTPLHGTFARYIEAMRRIDAAGVTRQADADAILQQYEPDLAIRHFLLGNLHRPRTPDHHHHHHQQQQQNDQGQGAGATTSPVQKFRIPLDILGRSLGHLGDFPFKDPSRARFAKPALFVRGTRSAYVPDEVIPLIGQFFPKFRMVDIDAGHWVISEKPDEFMRAVREFLTRQE